MALILIAAGCASTATRASIDPASALSWGANIGWINWHPSSTQGALIGEFVCSGYLYSANAGWIHLGSGAPANGIHYTNESGVDYGVNHDGLGNLRGLAWGANIGWISFNEQGQPRIDLVTGRMSGLAYGANVGWIQLGNATFGVRVASILPGADSDGDGLPDAWELAHAGNLTLLSARGDADGDGQSDLDEYLAGTDPLDPNDLLRITGFTRDEQSGSVQLTWPVRPSRFYSIESISDLGAGAWIDHGQEFLPPAAATATRNLPSSGPHEFFRIRASRPLAP